VGDSPVVATSEGRFVVRTHAAIVDHEVVGRLVILEPEQTD
jgi:hypothetical protein